MNLSDAELKELGITKELWQQWQKLMNTLWQSLHAVAREGIKNDGENGIVWKMSSDRSWVIGVYFINNERLQIQVERNGVDMFTIDHVEDFTKAAAMVISLIQLHEK